MIDATDPVGWIFAEECRHARRGDDGFITPTGAVLRRIFFIGVLTEVHVLNSRTVEARVTDPTGGFPVSVNRSCPLVADILAATQPPSFIALSGELLQRGGGEIQVIADSCQVVVRSDRDRFIYLCAEDTIRRLEAIGPLTDEQRQIAEGVKRALAVVAGSCEEIQPGGDRRVQMIAIIGSCSGPKGAPLEKIFTLAEDAGVDRQEAQAVISELLYDGDCYMPTTSTIRLL